MSETRFAFPLCNFFPALLVALAWLACLPSSALSAGRADCSAIKSNILGRAVRYCVLLPPSYETQKTRRYAVLYYLHGLGDNEQSLLRRGGWSLVEQLQDSGKIGEFLIATPDGGNSFYINSRDGRERYEDFFLREFIPAIECRYRAFGTRAGRGISGASMGGYGALRFAFQAPQMFTSVSAHSAALVEDLPQGFTLVSSGGDLSPFGEPFDGQFWKQNTPFTLVRQATALDGLKIYFDCGRQDDYGFDAGAQAFHELLQKRGIPHEFHLYPGSHGWRYVAEHFPASLAFHSRAFAAQE